MSVEGLKGLFDLLTVVVLGLAFVFGAGVLITGNIINKRQEGQLRQFDKDLTEAKTELGKQQVLAADASAKVAGLEKDVADAKTEMAKQQTKAATAERALLELQTRLAHRRIGPSERAEMVAKLRPYAGSIVALTKLGEAEAGQFADDLIAILTEAKWEIKLTNVGTMSPPPYGLQCLIDTRTKAGRALAEVLRPLPTASIQEAHRDAPQDVIVGTITVGLKRPA